MNADVKARAVRGVLPLKMIVKRHVLSGVIAGPGYAPVGAVRTWTDHALLHPE
jgi:hypothetical protein